VKPTPRSDFPVSARSYAQENEYGRPDLTGRSFWLSLNNIVDVTFVPCIGDLTDPDAVDVDNPRDEREASTALAIRNQYVVTVNNDKAGREEVVDYQDSEGNRTVLFFVSSDEYARFVTDLQVVGQRAGWAVQSTTLLSEIPDLPVLRFVRERFLTSVNVDARSKRMLGH
jgi:hypothetical protein